MAAELRSVSSTTRQRRLARDRIEATMPWASASISSASIGAIALTSIDSSSVRDAPLTQARTARS